MRCDYCSNEATARIPSNPGEVCRAHAIEFWTGLLAYAKAHRPEAGSDCYLSVDAGPVPHAFVRAARTMRARPVVLRGGRPRAAARSIHPIARMSGSRLTAE